MTLGERLKQTRNFLGYTQEELANLTGISRVSIGNYERDIRTPDCNTLMKLALALNTTTDYLIGNILPSENPTIADYAVGSIYHNYSTIKDTDFHLTEYLEHNGYFITPSIFNYHSEELGTEKYTQRLNDWKDPKKQYYTLTKNKDSFYVPPEAITEFETNIKHAIEFEWYKAKEKYKNYKPPTT